MNDNNLKIASDNLSDAIQTTANLDCLAKVGDWTFSCGGFGQITQIWPDFYEEYDEIPKGKKVGDYKGYFRGIIKYFCKQKHVRQNATDYIKILPDFKPIVEGDIRGYWDLIQKHIKENPEKYLSYQKYKPKMLDGHIHLGYSAGPRWGKSEHTKEFYINLFDNIRKDLPERFTFADLIDVAQKHQCPLKLDKPLTHGYVPTMYITLFYKIGEYQDKRKLFYCLGKYIVFENNFYHA